MSNDWAIVIGINHYEHLPQKKQLQYAVGDAETFKSFLCDHIGFDLDKVFLCTDTSEPSHNISTRPARSHLLDLLKFKICQVHPENLWFFFSGHGALGRDRHDYLLPCDGNPRDLKDTAISIDLIIRCLVECRARNTVLFLDMCRDEGLDDGSKSISEVGVETEKLSKQESITTFFSCSRGEASYEISELGQGSFTHILLEGLTSCKTPRELERYLIQGVSQVNKIYGKHSQTPMLRLEPGYKYDSPLLDRSIHQKVIDATPAPEKNEADSRSLRDLIQELYLQFPVSIINASQTFEFDVITVDCYGNKLDCHSSRSQLVVEETNGLGIEMVLIPSGWFLMGSPEVEGKRYVNERPQHRVTVPSFLMSRYPITLAQWRQVALLPEVHRPLKRRPCRAGAIDTPAVEVSWHDVVEFCARLCQKTGYEYRLPTEAEWEYACRAGTATPFHFGETITTDLVNYDGQYPYNLAPKEINRGKSIQVGQLKFANDFGLLGMHGNVWEWCADQWHENYQKAPIAGEAWIDNNPNFHRVMRGGSWTNEALLCRSAYRQIGDENRRYNNTGFRIVRSF